MTWIQSGVLAWVDLEGMERLYFPLVGPGHRPWPLVARPWRMRLAQIRFRAREALSRLGIPGAVPGLDAVWVPDAGRSALVALQERLEARLARLRREMGERYEELQAEARRRVQRLARRQIRSLPEGGRKLEGGQRVREILQIYLDVAEQIFPPPEFFQTHPRLVVRHVPVPAGWEGLIPVAGVRIQVAGVFWEMFWEMLGNGNAGHGRRIRRLKARLEKLPPGLLEGYPELGRLAAIARRALGTSGERLEQLESMRRLLEAAVRWPPQSL